MFTGEQFDAETGLTYLRARYYNPGTGRFNTQDRHPGDQTNPLTLNKYLYGNANPVMFIDPSGEFSLGEAMAVVAMMGMMGSSARPSYGKSMRSKGGGGGSKYNYTVPNFDRLHQLHTATCWATVATIVWSWGNETSMSVENLLNKADRKHCEGEYLFRTCMPFKDAYANNRLINEQESYDLLSALGGTQEHPNMDNPEDVYQTLKSIGPLGVTSKYNKVGNYMIVHDYVIIGIANGTDLRIYNPLKPNPQNDLYVPMNRVDEALHYGYPQYYHFNWHL